MITDGVLTLAPLRPTDAATHLAGEDAELARRLNGGPGTLPGVEAYIRGTLEQWVAGGPKLAFGIRVEDVLAGTIDVNLALPEAECLRARRGAAPSSGTHARPPLRSHARSAGTRPPDRGATVGPTLGGRHGEVWRRDTEYISQSGQEWLAALIT